MKTKEVTIFLIEDDDVDAMAIERGFTRHRIGNSIYRARDGLDALEKLKSGEVSKPYIILLDLQMPRMNGLEFLEAIRAEPEFSKSVIFVLTTSKSETDIASSYDQHIAGYLVKDEMGRDFAQVVSLIDGYWKIVHLPCEGNQ